MTVTRDFELWQKLHAALTPLQKENGFHSSVSDAKDNPLAFYVDTRVPKDGLGVGMTIDKFVVKQTSAKELRDIVRHYVKEEIEAEKSIAICFDCGQKNITTEVGILKNTNLAYFSFEEAGIDPNDKAAIDALYEKERICWSCFDERKQEDFHHLAEAEFNRSLHPFKKGFKPWMS